MCDSPSNMPKCNTLHAQFYTNSYTYYERSQLFNSIYVLFSVPGGYINDRSAPSRFGFAGAVASGSAHKRLIRTFAPFTRPAPHKFSQPNRLTLHPATNRNQTPISIPVRRPFGHSYVYF